MQKDMEDEDGVEAPVVAARPGRQWSFRPGKVAVAVAVAVAVGALAGFAGARAGNSSSHRSGVPVDLLSNSTPAVQTGAEVTVTGTATVQGTPDTATFTMGVTTNARAATAALAENNAEMRRLSHTLEANGVSPAGIQTSSLSISPNVNNNGVVTGFQVYDELDVTMSNLGAVGAAIDAGARAVGNDVDLYGISFSISNTSSLLAQARAQAMGNAQTEASQLAAGAGLSLGPVVRITDQENTQSTLVYPVFAAAASAAVPIHPGTQPLSVSVTVVYALES